MVHALHAGRTTYSRAGSLCLHVQWVQTSCGNKVALHCLWGMCISPDTSIELVSFCFVSVFKYCTEFFQIKHILMFVVVGVRMSAAGCVAGLLWSWLRRLTQLFIAVSSAQHWRLLALQISPNNCFLTWLNTFNVWSYYRIDYFHWTTLESNYTRSYTDGLEEKIASRGLAMTSGCNWTKKNFFLNKCNLVFTLRIIARFVVEES